MPRIRLFPFIKAPLSRGFAIILALCLAAPTVAVAQDAPTRALTVTGTGSAMAVPDIARVEVSAVATGATAAEALGAAAAATSGAIAVLGDRGVAERDMQTTSLFVSPVYAQRGGGQQLPGQDEALRITGFEARAGLSVILRNLDAIGPTLDALLEVGINQIGGVTFDISDPGSARDAARRAAVADAQARAALYADAAGVALGPLLFLQEGGSTAPIPMARMEAMAIASDMIAPGESEITASVTLQYEIR